MRFLAKQFLIDYFCPLLRRIYQSFSVRLSYVAVHVARTLTRLLRLWTAKSGAATFATGLMNVSLVHSAFDGYHYLDHKLNMQNWGQIE